jgi:hypothetical protein
VTLSPHVQAELHTETAAYLLDEAQLVKGTDPQTLGVLGAGYAMLAAAHQMAALVETVEGLAERVEELTDLVASRTRAPWWRRALAWRPRREVQAEAGYEAGPAIDKIEGQDDDGDELATVFTLPFLAGGAS